MRVGGGGGGGWVGVAGDTTPGHHPGRAVLFIGGAGWGAVAREGQGAGSGCGGCCRHGNERDASGAGLDAPCSQIDHHAVDSYTHPSTPSTPRSSGFQPSSFSSVLCVSFSLHSRCVAPLPCPPPSPLARPLSRSLSLSSFHPCFVGSWLQSSCVAKLNPVLHPCISSYICYISYLLFFYLDSLCPRIRSQDSTHIGCENEIYFQLVGY